jgi:hypothetical protein
MSEKLEDSEEVKIKAGKLNLVDLAGSERQSKTQAEGVRAQCMAGQAYTGASLTRRVI